MNDRAKRLKEIQKELEEKNSTHSTLINANTSNAAHFEKLSNGKVIVVENGLTILAQG